MQVRRRDGPLWKEVVVDGAETYLSTSEKARSLCHANGQQVAPIVW